ncbi:MAG: hypothetical protein SVY10_01465 [Thermodesulfobacteriota bacterium]|nr:hypothetical protein [Thermodesulfobacteriota bacterium]
MKTQIQGPVEWPSGGDRNLVLSQDMAVELGSPNDESVSFLIWRDDDGRVHDRCISTVGPDLPESVNKHLPFGKVVMIAGRNFSADNAYTRYREMEGLRYDVNLQGYMMRAVSQYLREWSRVSREAIERGFSLRILGADLIDRYHALDYVTAVEIIFVTSSRDDVLTLKKIGAKSARIISAMNKMAEELSFDCDTCEYMDVCQDVGALRSMRNSIKGDSWENV